MNVQVKKSDVKDLLKALETSWDITQKVLLLVKEALPYVEAMQTPEQERIVCGTITERYFEQNPSNSNEKEIRFRLTTDLPRLFTELHNHLPQYWPAMIDASLREVNAIQGMIEALERMQPNAVKAWQRLDSRTKAAIVVFSRLTAVDDWMNTTYYPDLFGIEGNPDILRSDPALDELMRAYDLAGVFLDAVGSCQEVDDAG